MHPPRPAIDMRLWVSSLPVLTSRHKRNNNTGMFKLCRWKLTTPSSPGPCARIQARGAGPNSVTLPTVFSPTLHSLSVLASVRPHYNSLRTCSHCSPLGPSGHQRHCLKDMHKALSPAKSHLAKAQKVKVVRIHIIVRGFFRKHVGAVVCFRSRRRLRALRLPQWPVNKNVDRVAVQPASVLLR